MLHHSVADQVALLITVVLTCNSETFVFTSKVLENTMTNFADCNTLYKHISTIYLSNKCAITLYYGVVLDRVLRF